MNPTDLFDQYPPIPASLRRKKNEIFRHFFSITECTCPLLAPLPGRSLVLFQCGPFHLFGHFWSPILSFKFSIILKLKNWCCISEASKTITQRGCCIIVALYCCSLPLSSPSSSSSFIHTEHNLGVFPWPCGNLEKVG